MKKEEAIKIIDCYDLGFYDLSGEKIPADKLADAFDMAIEALESQETGEWVEQSGMTRGAKMTKEDIYKVAFDLISVICVREGHSERALSKIMGVMSMATEIENIIISEQIEE